MEYFLNLLIRRKISFLHERKKNKPNRKFQSFGPFCTIFVLFFSLANKYSVRMFFVVLTLYRFHSDFNEILFKMGHQRNRDSTNISNMYELECFLFCFLFGNGLLWHTLFSEKSNLPTTFIMHLV